MLKYAEKELNELGKGNKEGILYVIKEIIDQEHSGFSIGFIKGLIKQRLTREDIVKLLEKQNGEEYGVLICEDMLRVHDKIKKVELNDYDMDLLYKLISYEPVTLLTGEDSEWEHVYDTTYQNKKCPALFKEADGKIYFLDGIVFRDGDSSYTGWTKIKEMEGTYVSSKVIPKDLNNRPTIKINVVDDYISLNDLEEAKKYYELILEKIK